VQKKHEQPLSRLKSVPFVTLLCLALAVSAAACTLPAPIRAPSSTETSMPPQTALTGSFVEVPEMTFIGPDLPLPDGPVNGLIGLYGEYGSPVLSTSRIEQNRLLSNRNPVELQAIGPQLIEVSGQISSGKLSAASWKPFTWDEAGQRSVAQAHLDQLAPALASYDWSRIARPDFAESSSQYHPTEEQLRALSVDLFGYDAAGNRIIWRAQGPDMPPQKPLVRRYSALYIVTDPADKMPSELFVTIEGYVEE
jgi:hypothetical protein